jgi:hypothetical protein
VEKLWLEAADIADVSLVLNYDLSNTTVELKEKFLQ